MVVLINSISQWIKYILVGFYLVFVLNIFRVFLLGYSSFVYTIEKTTWENYEKNIKNTKNR